MRYHGNYCGPNWSAGKHQGSVVSDVPAVDDFDDTCRLHDASYANHDDLLLADLHFAHQNFGKGIKRTAAAVAVGGQAAFRALDKFIPRISQIEKKMSLRGSKSTVVTKSVVPASSKKSRSVIEQVNVPATMGTVLRGGMSTTTKKSKDTISMDVQVCIGKPTGTTQSVIPELVAVQYLSPVALGNDEVQNMTRVYQYFRITQAQLHFRAIQATSVGGEVIVVADADPNYRPINTTGGTSFYQRALATKHSLLTPIWMSESMDLPVDAGWKLCDNSNSTTLEEFVSGVAYIYGDGNSAAATTGYFLVSMHIEFSGLRFNARNLISGSYLGLGVRLSLQTLAPVTNADVILVGTGFSTGDIYAVQVSATGATIGAGTTTTAWSVTSGAGTINFTIGGSSVLYGRASSSTQIALFITYDACTGGDSSDKLTHNLTSASISTFPACVVTQLRNSTQPTL